MGCSVVYYLASQKHWALGFALCEAVRGTSAQSGGRSRFTRHQPMLVEGNYRGPRHEKQEPCLALSLSSNSELCWDLLGLLHFEKHGEPHFTLLRRCLSGRLVWASPGFSWVGQSMRSPMVSNLTFRVWVRSPSAIIEYP